jgi:hypothetical protein
MTARIQTFRSSTTGTRPSTTRPVGELFVNLADNALGVMDATPAARDLLPIRYHSATANYAAAAIVQQAGGLFQAKAAITAKPFNIADWDQFYTTVQGDTRWLRLSGGTLTGALTLSGPPTLANHATTRSYVDAGDALKLNLSGGTLTGPLILAADPAVPLGASTKQYTDTKLPLAGGTLTGLLTLSGAPTSDLHAATKLYVDNQTGAVTAALAGYLSLAGGTMTGFLTLSGAPTSNLHAATKAYVDGVAGAYLPLAGGTITGGLTISGPGGLSVTGNTLISGSLTVSLDASVRSLLAAGNNMLIGPGGDGAIMQFAPNYYWDWSNVDGSLVMISNGSRIWTIRASDAACYNNIAWVGGHGAYRDVSDERLKTDITPATVGLPEILAIDPINFHRLGPEGEVYPADEIGFSAQNVQPIIPEAVTETGIGLPDALAVASEMILAAAVNAIKTLNERVAALEAT